MKNYSNQEKLNFEARKLMIESRPWLIVIKVLIVPLVSLILAVAIYFTDIKRQATQVRISEMESKTKLQVSTMNLVLSNYEKFFSRDSSVYKNIYATFYIVKEAYKTEETDSIYTNLIALADSFGRDDIVKATKEIENEFKRSPSFVSEFVAIEIYTEKEELQSETLRINIGDYSSKVKIENGRGSFKIPKRYFNRSEYFLKVRYKTKLLFNDPINETQVNF